MNSVLDAGFPPGPSSDLTMLMFEKRAIVLPLLERKIEQVLASPSPSDYFTDKAVDPQKFVDRVAWVIATTGDAEALTEVSKLVKLDAKRFGRLVDITLNTSMDYSKSHNPFVVAYSGLSLGDPVVDGLILAWTEKYLSIDPEDRARAEAAARGLGPPPPPLAEKMKQLWVDAMLERSGGVPTEAQWATDPIASGLSRPLAVSVHSEIPELIGSVQALVEISKIFQLDGHWSNYGSNYPPPGENPFGVAYIGLAIGNPTTQHLILEWAEKHLTVVAETMKHVWADAVLTR